MDKILSSRRTTTRLGQACSSRFGPRVPAPGQGVINILVGDRVSPAASGSALTKAVYIIGDRRLRPRSVEGFFNRQPKPEVRHDGDVVETTVD